jgi:non-homologous end joining protein Ku
MVRFVDQSDIDSRYFEKPYYLLPDGGSAEEGYVVLRDALAKSKKVAVGQLIMSGREHRITMLGKRWQRYESLSISECYTARPYQASVLL